MTGIGPTDDDTAAAIARVARDKKLRRVAVRLSILVVVLAAAVLAPGAASDYFYSDSELYIVENEVFRAIPLSEFWRLWQTPLFWQELLPLRDFVYRVEMEAFGLEPIPYKVVDLFLLVLCGLAVWTFANDFHRRFPAGSKTWAAPGVAAAVTLILWVAHPSHVESVAWAAGLKDVLSGVLGLAALCAFQRALPMPAEPQHVRLRPLAAATLLFSAALMSKITVAPVAGMALLLAVAALSRSTPSWRALANGVLATLPLLVIAVTAVSIQATLGTAGAYIAGDSPEITGGRFERAVRILGTMFQMGLIPYDLRLTWDVYGGGALGTLRFAFAVLAIFGACWGAWAFAFRRIPEGFGLAAAVGVTVPVLHLIPFDTWSLASERHLFWPLFGLALAAGSLAARATARGRHMLGAAAVAVGATATIWLGLTLHRSLEWLAGPKHLHIVENEADPSWGAGAFLRIEDDLAAGRWDVALETAMRVEDKAQRNLLRALVLATQAVTQAKRERGARSAILKADRMMLEAEAAVRAVLASAWNPTFRWLVYSAHRSLIPLYEKLIGLAPEQGAFPYNLGLIKKNFIDQTEQSEAEKLFLQAIETRRLPPVANANAWDQVAIIRIRRDDLTGARQALLFAMDADPAGYRAAYRLAVVAAVAGDLEVASNASRQFRERALAAGMDPGEIADRIKNIGRIDNIAESIIIQ
jgi:hypothetical protein